MHEYTTLIKLSNFSFVLNVLNCGYFSVKPLRAFILKSRVNYPPGFWTTFITL